MALSSGGFDALGGAISGIFGGVGALQTASGYKAAASLYGQQAGLYGQAVDASNQQGQIAQAASQITEMQSQRQIYQAIGGQKADVAGSGLAASGSALDLLRSSTSQGNLTMGLLHEQGAITQEGYKEQGLSYQAMQGAALASQQTATAQASASKSSGIGGILGGALKVAGAIAMFV